MTRFAERFGAALPVIGVIRLPPLPDRPGSPGLSALIEHACADLQALRDGGANGALIVNENDQPHRLRAQSETISAMSRILRAIIDDKGDMLIGCQILLNDPIASLAVARTSGADFIRCEHFVDPMERADYGAMMIDPDGLIAYRREINAQDILVLADIQVRNSEMTEQRSLRESARQACLHLADAVIVTGTEPGVAPRDPDIHDALAGIADSNSNVPLLLGGGVHASNAHELLSVSDGAIVGTGISADDGHIDAKKVVSLMSIVAELRAN